MTSNVENQNSQKFPKVKCESRNDVLLLVEYGRYNAARLSGGGGELRRQRQRGQGLRAGLVPRDCGAAEQAP